MRLDRLVATRQRLHDTGHSTDGRSYGAENYVISLRVLSALAEYERDLIDARAAPRSPVAHQLLT
jgi:DNA invertase Pin-like site-specific DNA recombinase